MYLATKTGCRRLSHRKENRVNHDVLGKILILSPCFGLRMSSPISVRSSRLSTASTLYFLSMEDITTFSSSKANFWPANKIYVTTWIRIDLGEGNALQEVSKLTADCKMSNRMVIHEAGKKLTGRTCGLIEVISRRLPGRSWENH